MERNIIQVVIVLSVLMLSALILAPLQGQSEAQVKQIGISQSEQVTVNSTKSLGPYQLSYYPIVEDSETISIGSTVYTRDIDYTMDYDAGTFTVISGSSLEADTATDTQVNVTYEQVDPDVLTSWSDIKDATWGSMSMFTIVPYVVIFVVIIGLIMAIARR